MANDLADNTNPDPDTRAQWVELAKKNNIPIRCVWFNTPISVCLHNDAVRSLNKAVRQIQLVRTWEKRLLTADARR